MKPQEIDRIESAIRHIQTAVDVDPWARDIAVEAMEAHLSAKGTTLVSRQAAIDAIVNWAESHHENPDGDDCIMIILDVPPAHTERKVGHWLIREGISDAQCSECKMYFNNVYDMDSSDAFCRHCGAKMEGLKVVKDECFNQQTGGD